MSINGNHSTSNGKFKMKKVKDSMHGSGGVLKWKGKFTMLLHVVFVVGISWFFYGLTSWLTSSQNKILLCGDFKNLLFRDFFDSSSHQLHGFSDQVNLCNKNLHGKSNLRK